MKIGVLSSKLKFLQQIENLKQFCRLWKQKMANMHLFITLKSNSSFGAIAKATGIKMTAKAISKNSRFCFSGHAAKHICVNENLLL